MCPAYRTSSFNQLYFLFALPCGHLFDIGPLEDDRFPPPTPHWINKISPPPRSLSPHIEFVWFLISLHFFSLSCLFLRLQVSEKVQLDVSWICWNSLTTLRKSRARNPAVQAFARAIKAKTNETCYGCYGKRKRVWAQLKNERTVRVSNKKFAEFFDSVRHSWMLARRATPRQSGSQVHWLKHGEREENRVDCEWNY